MKGLVALFLLLWCTITIVPMVVLLLELVVSGKNCLLNDLVSEINR
jgi:uncharacterized membrane protein